MCVYAKKLVTDRRQPETQSSGAMDCREKMFMIQDIKSKPTLNGKIVRKFNPNSHLSPKEGRQFVAESTCVPSAVQQSKYEQGAYKNIEIISIANENLCEFRGIDPWFLNISFSKRARITENHHSSIKRMRTRYKPSENKYLYAMYFSGIELYQDGDFVRLSPDDYERIVLNVNTVEFVSVQLLEDSDDAYTMRIHAPDDHGFDTYDLIDAIRNFTTGETELEMAHGFQESHACFFEGLYPAGYTTDGVLRLTVQWGS